MVTLTEKPTLESKVKGEFKRYFAEEYDLAFGMSSSRLISKLENIIEFNKGTNIDKYYNISFEGRDYIELGNHPENGDVVLAMNRKYDKNHSLCGFGLVSKVIEKNKNYTIITSSSEIARSTESGIYDLTVKIIDNKTKEQTIIKEKYAMKERIRNSKFVSEFISNVKEYLIKNKKIKEKEIYKKLEETENAWDVYRANTEIRPIEEKGIFHLTPYDSGFFMSCKNFNSESPFFYSKFYKSNGKTEHNPIKDEIEKKYEEAVYHILTSSKDINKKLDACMILFENKQQFERAYPLSPEKETV